MHSTDSYKYLPKQLKILKTVVKVLLKLTISDKLRTLKAFKINKMKTESSQDKCYLYL